MAPPTSWTIVTTWGNRTFTNTWAEFDNTEAARRIDEAKFLHEYDLSEAEFLEGMREQYLYPSGGLA